MAGKFNWTDERTWPIDGVEHLFIGRMIAELGVRQYGDEWTSMQAKYNHKMKYLPDQDIADIFARAEAARLMGKNYRFSLKRGSEPDSLSELEWGKAQTKKKIIADVHNLGLERWQKIKATIHEAFQYGRLVCFLRNTSRTDYSDFVGPLKKNTWNIDDTRKRFESCQMSYQHGHAARGIFWIFVERKSAEVFLLKASNAECGAQQPFSRQNSGGRSAEAIKLEKDCAQWIYKMFISRSKSKKTHTKREIHGFAVDKYPIIGSLSKDGRPSRTFERVWKEATKNSPKWCKGDES